MGHFYFHLRAGDQLILDDEGLDLPDVSAARREAMQSDFGRSNQRRSGQGAGRFRDLR